MEWLEKHNRFCNSLVDRIVPGKPDAATKQKLESELSYQDDLLTMSEVYRLWAIEGDEKVASVLSFATVDEGVVIAPDITVLKNWNCACSMERIHWVVGGFSFRHHFGKEQWITR